MLQTGTFDPELYKKIMIGKQFLIVGLTSAKGSHINNKIGSYMGVEYQPIPRALIKIQGDDTIYKIRPRNLVPKGYTLQTIHKPYQVMTLAEEEQYQTIIANAQQQPQQKKPWKLCFKYVGPQKNYCFICQQFNVSNGYYCGYCMMEYLCYLNVQRNKLMTIFRRCQGCGKHGRDYNLIGYCQQCCK